MIAIQHIRRLLQGLDVRPQRILTQAFELVAQGHDGLARDIATLQGSGATAPPLAAQAPSSSYVIVVGGPTTLPDTFNIPLTFETIVSGSDRLAEVNADRLVLPPGLWWVHVTVIFAPNPTGGRALSFVQQSGVTTPAPLAGSVHVAASPNVESTTIASSRLYTITVQPAWIGVEAWQSSGNDLVVDQTVVQALRVGDV